MEGEIVPVVDYPRRHGFFIPLFAEIVSHYGSPQDIANYLRNDYASFERDLQMAQDYLRPGWSNVVQTQRLQGASINRLLELAEDWIRFCFAFALSSLIQSAAQGQRRHEQNFDREVMIGRAYGQLMACLSWLAQWPELFREPDRRALDRIQAIFERDFEPLTMALTVEGLQMIRAAPP